MNRRDWSKAEGAGMLVLVQETTHVRTFPTMLQRCRRRNLGADRADPGAGPQAWSSASARRSIDLQRDPLPAAGWHPLAHAAPDLSELADSLHAVLALGRQRPLGDAYRSAPRGVAHRTGP